MSSPVAFLGTVPTNYDRYLGPFLFEPYAIDLVKRMYIEDKDQVLELACGTGRVTAHLKNALHNKGSLVATDLNNDMILMAKERLPDKNIKWKVADAQDLPFKDYSFNWVVCQFGVMFFPDKSKAFAEAFRVLKPEGKFLFNTWDSVDFNPGTYLIQKAMIDVFKDDAPDFIQKGPFSYYNSDEIREDLQQAGFTRIIIEKVPMVGRTDSIDDMINGYLKGTPLAAYLSEKDIGLQKELAKQIRIQLSTYYGESDLEIPMQALICKASK
jgi:ubiquinone/menaquinone biosynthesis C-methylase UbiE